MAQRAKDGDSPQSEKRRARLGRSFVEDSAAGGNDGGDDETEADDSERSLRGTAVALLPPELKPFFERYQDEIIVRVVDPDRWRLVGWDEDPNHFVDFGVAEYGKPPFDALPRDYGQALQKFGAAALKRNGLLPWREAEV